MGWLELLPLLKRLLPLLNRVAPMLESFVAGRAATGPGADAAVERMGESIRGQLAETAQRHDSVAEMLATQGNQLKTLSDSINRQRATDDRTAGRLLEIESGVAALARSLRTLTILQVVLMVACLGLLITLLVRVLR